MRLLDYYFYSIYLFGVKIKGGDEEWNARLILSLVISFFFVGILAVSGILWDNCLAQCLKTNMAGVVWFPIFIIVNYLLFIRYNRFESVQSLADKYNKLNPNRRFMIGLSLIIAIIAVFCFTYIAIRLYVYGEVPF